jgi:SAM-dependent methyltransferase
MYKTFIHNSTLTECQKKMFAHYFNQLNTKYSKTDQLTKLIKYSKTNYQYLARLQSLLANFFSPLFISKLFLIDKKNDKEYIQYILSETKKNPGFLGKEKGIEGGCGAWDYMIENLAKSYKQLSPQFSSSVYLDIGCGNGAKTVKFGKQFGIPPANIFGADIPHWGPYKAHKHPFQFSEILEGGRLQYADNSIDLITCVLMLHHVKDLDQLLSEINRVLKVGGFLLIIEHNNLTDYDNMTLEMLHMLYGYLYDGNMKYLEAPDFSSYKNWLEWDYVMKPYFSYVKGNILLPNLVNDTRYDNIFYTFYKKNSEEQCVGKTEDLCLKEKSCIFVNGEKRKYCKRKTRKYTAFSFYDHTKNIL